MSDLPEPNNGGYSDAARGRGTFPKAMFYGLGAAVLGSIIYAGVLALAKKYGVD